MSRGPDVEPSMSFVQRAIAYLAILAFGVPSVLIALTGGEVWPFLDYRMYADAKLTSEVEWLALVGRTRNDAAFPLDDEQYIVPFALSELLRALYNLDIHGETDATPSRRALRGLLAAYEQNRLAGEHNGPRLVALEVYRLQWDARPSPFETGPFSQRAPDAQVLIQTVYLSDVNP